MFDRIDEATSSAVFRFLSQPFQASGAGKGIVLFRLFRLARVGSCNVLRAQALFMCVSFRSPSPLQTFFHINTLSDCSCFGAFVPIDRLAMRSIDSRCDCGMACASGRKLVRKKKRGAKRQMKRWVNLRGNLGECHFKRKCNGPNGLSSDSHHIQNLESYRWTISQQLP
jgi:hypothetical protein